MRIRLDPVAAHHAEQIGNRFNRSPSNVASVAIAEYAHNHMGSAQPMTPEEAEQVFGTGRPIAVFASGALAGALKKFARREERSISGAMKVLLRDALKLHGITIPYRTTAPADAGD